MLKDGISVGMVSIHDIKSLPQKRWKLTAMRDAMTPMSKLRQVHPEDELSDVMEALTHSDINQLPVIGDDGRIIDMVARDNLLAYIQTRSELGT